MPQPVRSLILVLAVAGAGASATRVRAEPPAPAREIRSVLDLTRQPCNGGGAEAWTRDPSEAAIRRAKALQVPGLGWRLRVPRLPQADEVVVKIRRDDRSRGVVEHYVLLGEEEFGAPSAAIVVTELPQDIDDRERAFAAARLNVRGLAGTMPGFVPELRAIDGPHGPALEMLVPQRVGSPCFPTSGFAIASPGVETLGITRFAYTRGHLVEFTIIVPVEPAHAPARRAARAREVMDGFWASLTPP
jgi:hypothetical protein